MTTERRGAAEPRCSQPTADTLQVELSDRWQLQRDVPSATAVAQQLDATPGVQRLTFETQELGGWDSGLVTCVLSAPSGGPQYEAMVAAMSQAVAELSREIAAAIRALAARASAR